MDDSFHYWTEARLLPDIVGLLGQVERLVKLHRACDFTLGAGDTSTYRVSHTDRKTKNHAAYAQQVAAAAACSKPKEAAQGMFGVSRRLWQDFVRGPHEVRG